MKHDDASDVSGAAAVVFGDGLERAQRYADILAGRGVDRGLIGPRETPRLWERHLLNSAVVAELVEHGAAVADIGSGAGLPGIPLAIARPDLRITLIEPLLRRSTFLDEVVEELDLDTVTVVRGRAEDPAVRREHHDFDTVVSRAVASLDKIARWSLPLLRVGGTMLAMKGDRAEAEVEEYRHTLGAMGMGEAKVVRCGADNLITSATVVVARRSAPGRAGRGSRRSGEKKGR